MTTVVCPAVAVVSPQFGELWGPSYFNPSYLTQEGQGIWLWRKGQRCRYFDAAGEQYGPEHLNVFPAAAWAQAEGCINPHAIWESFAVPVAVQLNDRTEAEQVAS